MLELVAHRGYPLAYPENTIEGLRGAIEAGARFVEFDVQLAADRVPVVYHDATLARTSDWPGSVFDATGAELIALPAGERARFGERFARVRVPSLAAVAELLAAHPECTAFVELKEESIERFGPDAMIAATLPEVAAIRDQAVMISFDREVLPGCRQRGLPIGWVIRAYDEATHAQLAELAPEYVFSNIKRLPAGPAELWSGPWQWVVYDASDLATARTWADRGVRLVETMAIGELMRELRGS